MRPLRAAASTAAVLCLLTGSAPAAYTRVPPPPTGSGTVVLQLKEWKSLVGPGKIAEIPEATVLADGRVIVPAGRDGALQRAAEFTLTPDRFRRLYRLAHEAGLARDRELAPRAEATDGSTLLITLRSGGRTHTTRLITPGAGEPGVRGRIIRFRHRLPALLEASPVREYRPDAWAVLGGKGTRTYLGTCTVTPDVPPTLIDPLVTVRPLLPHERTCADLDLFRP